MRMPMLKLPNTSRPVALFCGLLLATAGAQAAIQTVIRTGLISGVSSWSGPITDAQKATFMDAARGVSAAVSITYDDAAQVTNAPCGTYAMGYCSFDAVRNLSFGFSGKTYSAQAADGQTMRFRARNDPSDSLNDYLAYTYAHSPAASPPLGHDPDFVPITGPDIAGLHPLRMELYFTETHATVIGAPLPTVNRLQTLSVIGEMRFWDGVDPLHFVDLNLATPAAPVPEPSTWACFALGLAAIGFRARQNDKKC